MSDIQHKIIATEIKRLDWELKWMASLVEELEKYDKAFQAVKPKLDRMMDHHRTQTALLQRCFGGTELQ